MWKLVGPFMVRQRSLVACALIALAALLAYGNSLSAPYVFDDVNAIVNNPTIRSLWPIWHVVSPLGGGITVSGRPVLNLSFAINYALGGLEVRGYHLANLGIHILAAFALYGFVRRTLLRPALSPRFGADSWALALVIAVLWVLHPLQTESVTYLAQRAESLSGLLYLLVLYCFVRGVEAEGGKGWLWAAVFFCAAGMGCKETVASAPLIVWLYDRTFVAGTFLEALRRRRAIYVAMASTWLLLAYFILALGARGGSAELAIGATTLGYLQTQCYAIVEYLRLAVWPHPLIFDYGTQIITDPKKFALPAVLLLLLVAATVVGIGRRSPWGFLGCWFFAVLAPSSSVVAVVTQTMAEHRMYLPLAVVITVLVLVIYGKLGWKCLPVCLVVALGLGWLTAERNRDYRSEYSIWADTVHKCPTNARALANLATICLKGRQFATAKALVEESIRLNPNYAEARSDMGIILCASGQMNEGVAQFEKAAQINPSDTATQINLGVALCQIRAWSEAKYHLEEALRLDPGNALAAKFLDAVRVEMEKGK